MKYSPKFNQFLRTHRGLQAIEQQIKKLEQRKKEHEEILENDVHLLTDQEYQEFERIRHGGNNTHED